MKNLALTISLLMVSFSARAQYAILDRYPNIPTQYDAAFVDQVKEYVGGVAKTSYGQYFGQMTPDHNIYGFGSFYTDGDGVVTGQYRRGNFLFGIKMGSVTAKVGTDTHYTCYDLQTGDPIYIFKDTCKYALPEDYAKTYRFESLRYPNGDKYVGETVNGERDGVGIYYYENGDYYYGRYRANERKGFGAMFKVNNTIIIQYWKEEWE